MASIVKLSATEPIKEYEDLNFYQETGIDQNFEL